MAGAGLEEMEKESNAGNALEGRCGAVEGGYVESFLH